MGELLEANLKPRGKRKRCSACRKELHYDAFHRDARKTTGRTSRCKKCVAMADKKRATYTPMKKAKDVIRNRSKYIYAGTHECAVLRCTAKGQLHHIDYDNAEEVIPLCSKHHRQVHHLETLMKNINDIKDFHANL